MTKQSRLEKLQKTLAVHQNALSVVAQCQFAGKDAPLAKEVMDYLIAGGQKLQAKIDALSPPKPVAVPAEAPAGPAVVSA